jgi:hypothetical protein
MAGRSFDDLTLAGRQLESRNKALVLEAFDTLFNKRDYAVAERSGRPTTFNTVHTYHQVAIKAGRGGQCNFRRR